MYRLTSKLIIYRGIGEDSILRSLADICRQFDSGDYDRETMIEEIYEQVHSLLDLATTYGFNKNLWHNYLAYLIATTETPFTLVSEKVGANKGSVNAFALNDFKIFRELFNYDFGKIESALGIGCFSILEDYTAVGKPERVFNRSVSEKVQELSAAIESVEEKGAEKETGSSWKPEQEMYDIITGFYKEYGVGKFGLNKAFRINDENKEKEFLIPITATSDVQLEDLVGYDLQKQKLIANTEAFVEGRMANNVLLYGDAGTGKSTSIKAILNRYYSKGLRMIEVYKHQFKDLQRIISEIKNRNYRFIIYMDDLSFEEFETEYKYLKAGDVQQKASDQRDLGRQKRQIRRRDAPQRHGPGEVISCGALRCHDRLLQAFTPGISAYCQRAGETLSGDHIVGTGTGASGQSVGASQRRRFGKDCAAVHQLSCGQRAAAGTEFITRNTKKGAGWLP